jgi:hypothetical protein
MKSTNAVLALALILGIAALTLLITSAPSSHSGVSYQSVVDPMKGGSGR